MNETEHPLALVRVALDTFDGVSLAVSVRRARRIAQLRGDAEDAWRFGMDMRPIGGPPEQRIRHSRDIWPEKSYEEVREKHHALVEEMILERSITMDETGETTGSRGVWAGSVQELEARQALFEAEIDSIDDSADRFELVKRVWASREVLERIRHRTFIYLCTCERELMFGATISRTFDLYQTRAESFIKQIAPEILEQFNAAHRRSADGNLESRSQALTSCRRILKAAADAVFPARDEPVIDAKGVERMVGPEQYRNRLLLSLERATSGGSERKLIHATVEEFAKRIEHLDTVANKGVHAEVTQDEVNLCVIQTYLITSEILRLHAETASEAT